MAVLAAARGTGVGSALLTALMDESRRRGGRETIVSAQTHAIAFYARHGFVTEGNEYDDAGIPHITMRCAL
jgi:predicted GNAT family N-acyltransferase